MAVCAALSVGVANTGSSSACAAMWSRVLLAAHRMIGCGCHHASCAALNPTDQQPQQHSVLLQRVAASSQRVVRTAAYCCKCYMTLVDGQQMAPPGQLAWRRRPQTAATLAHTNSMSVYLCPQAILSGSAVDLFTPLPPAIDRSCQVHDLGTDCPNQSVAALLRLIHSLFILCSALSHHVPGAPVLLASVSFAKSFQRSQAATQPSDSPSGARGSRRLPNGTTNQAPVLGGRTDSEVPAWDLQLCPGAAPSAVRDGSRQR